MKRRYFLLAWLVCASLTQAAEFTVTNIADAGEGSLRQAILDANAAVGDDTISCTVTGTVVLASALPTITDNTEIIGPGTNDFIVSGNNQFAVFSMNSGTTNTLLGLTIANGWAAGNPNISPRVFTYASGISNAGTLRLTNCVVRNCTNICSIGVGIFNAGNLDMETCVVSECRAATNSPNYIYGGGIYNLGRLRVKDSLVNGCNAKWPGSGRTGGGIYNAGDLYLTNSVIANCSAGGGQTDGGGILSSETATIHSCVITNCAAWWGGGLLLSGVVAMTNTVVANNSADVGGGFFMHGYAVLNGCTISSNYCDGAAIQCAGELKMYNCTVALNRGANQPKAGLSDYYSLDGQAGSIYLNHCTVISNLAVTASTKVDIWSEEGFRAENSILGSFKGTLNSGGHNLIVNTNFSEVTITNDLSGNLYNVNPLLGPLRNNGGPTWTYALLPGSPAIDHANAGGLSTDQRGEFRPYDDPTVPNTGDGSDIGAHEASASPQLRAARSAADVMIVWSALWPDYTLEQTTSPISPNWTPVGITPTDDGLNKNVQLPVTPENRIFRLRKP